MARNRITREVARTDYEELWQFLGCYLHEDWPEMHGSPEGAVDDAISEATPARLRNAHQQFTNLLQQAEDDVDLKRILMDCFGVNVHFRKPKDARAFADTVDSKLKDALKDSK